MKIVKVDGLNGLHIGPIGIIMVVLAAILAYGWSYGLYLERNVLEKALEKDRYELRTSQCQQGTKPCSEGLHEVIRSEIDYLKRFKREFKA